MKLRSKALEICRKETNKLKGDCPVFRILVIGETGTGKSTLVNNLLGMEAAEVSHSLSSKTAQVHKHSMNIDGVPIEIFDTPGLGDSSCNRDNQYLKVMKRILECEEIHLVIYCMKLSETKMRESIIRTFQEYNKIGVKWEHTVIALTFADFLPVPPNEKKNRGLDMGHYFNGKVAEVGASVRRALIEKVEIPQEQARNIICCPTTGDPEELLQNGKEWYMPLWLDIFATLSPAAAVRFLEIQVPYLESSPSADVPAPNSHPNTAPSSNTVSVANSHPNRYPSPNTVLVMFEGCIFDNSVDDSGSVSGIHAMSYSCIRRNQPHFLQPQQEERLFCIYAEMLFPTTGVGAIISRAAVLAIELGGTAGLGSDETVAWTGLGGAAGLATGSFVGGFLVAIGGPVSVVAGASLGAAIGGVTGSAIGAAIGRGIGFIKDVFSQD